MRRRSRCLGDDCGATATEYALIAALIAVVIIAAVTLLGSNLVDSFNDSASSVAGAMEG